MSDDWRPMMGDIVMGPCPGCDDWQIQFNPADITPYEMESIVAEHARKECPGLMAAMITSVFEAGPNNAPDILVGMEAYQVVDPDA